MWDVGGGRSRGGWEEGNRGGERGGRWRRMKEDEE